MDKEMVSILMPSYNHAPFVEAAVRSVMEQKGVDFELLVIDDGSSDESPQILKKLSEELGFYFFARENKGMVATLNELAVRAKGEYLCTLASDDIMPVGRLFAQVAYMEEHKEIPACFGQAKKILPSGELEEKEDALYLKGIPEVSFEDLFLGEKHVHGCTELIRKDAFDSVGGYSQKFKIEDFPLWLALSYKYGNLPVLPQVFCHYRILENNKNMHKNLSLVFTQILDIIEIYKSDKFYKKAKNNWKAHWFSRLARYDKKEAFLKFPKLCSFSWKFICILPKFFIPEFIQQYKSK